VVNESQLTKARVTRLEALEQDFLAGNEALKKEHRGTCSRRIGGLQHGARHSKKGAASR
jgi:hypothetical protein